MYLLVKTINFDNFESGLKKIIEIHKLFITNVKNEIKVLINVINQILECAEFEDENATYENIEILNEYYDRINVKIETNYDNLIKIRDYYLSTDDDEFIRYSKYRSKILKLIRQAEYYYFKNSGEINAHEELMKLNSNDDELTDYLMSLYSMLLD